MGADYRVCSDVWSLGLTVLEVRVQSIWDLFNVGVSNVARLQKKLTGTDAHARDWLFRNFWFRLTN